MRMLAMASAIAVCTLAMSNLVSAAAPSYLAQATLATPVSAATETEISGVTWRCEGDKCEGKGNVIVDAMMTALSFNTCAGGARINSYLLTENTHAWPARSVLFRTFDANGKVTSERDATGRMWEFFKNTRSPEETPLTAGDATERSG